MVRPFFPLAAALAGGILAGSYFYIEPRLGFFLLAALLVMTLACAIAGIKQVVFYGLLASVFLLGTLDIGRIVNPVVPPDHISLLAGKEVVFADVENVGFNMDVSRLERIVQDVLSFARPSDPRLETVAADTLLREVQGLMSPNLESRAVQLIVEPGPELLMRADSGHLKQVLVNLISNAADAIDGAGTVILRARAGLASLDGQETDAVLLEVSDTGKGIPPHIQERMFDPFFSTKETGTGLGLSIAARIIQKHGGALQYQTRPGHGTTFEIVLPRESEHAARHVD